MASLLLYRAAALVTLGVIAGGIHAMVREKPVTLGLKAPAPLKLPVKNGEGAPAGDGKAPAGVPGAPSNPPPATDTAGPVQPPAPPVGAGPMDAINISIAQAKELYDAKVVFLDARHLSEYEEGHVAGALMLNTDTFATPAGGEVIGMLDRDAPVVVYCGGGMCDASKNLVRLLQDSGFMQARIMHDGYPAWVKAGYPTGTGRPPIGGG